MGRLPLLLPGVALLILVGWALGTFVVPHLQGLDVRVGSWLLAHGQPMINAMLAVSFLGSGLMITIVGVTTGVELLRRRRMWSVLLIAVSAIGATIVSSSVKLLVDRPRPPIHDAVVTGASFPSGHATESIAFYGVVAVVVCQSTASRWMRIVTIVCATALVAAIATSRIVLGVHFFTDVLAGLVLGGIWLALSVSATPRPSTQQLRRDDHAS